MTLNEMLPAIQALSRADKFRLIQFVAQDMAEGQEPAPPLTDQHVPSPVPEQASAVSGGARSTMSIAEAKALLVAQVDPDEGTGEPQTFLGGLRPYRGILPRRRFYEIMDALRVLAPTLGTTDLVDREVVSALFHLCGMTQLWALDEDGMLRGNGLLSEGDLAVLKEWHEMLSLAVMFLLEGVDVDVAFEVYDRYRSAEGGPHDGSHP